ncbi:MAG: DUF6814 family protein, partial [Chitinophagaceae bacterium]
PGNDFSTTTTTHFFYTDGSSVTLANKVITQPGNQQNQSSKTILVSEKEKWILIFMVFLLEFIFTISYGPLAAFMVEMFPLKIRYTSLSLPYHFGYGIFGGMAPYFATYLVQKAQDGNKPNYYLAGLSYPIVLMCISVVIGFLYLKENNRKQAVRLIPVALSNQLKKWLGIVWILLGFVATWFGIFKMGIPKILSGRQDDVVFGIIMMCIIMPIAVAGLFIFGKYALQGEYADE